MLFLQYPLYRERLYWKISFGAEKIVRFMEYLLCDCPLYRDFSITVNLRSTCSKRHCRLIEVSALYRVRFRDIPLYFVLECRISH